MLHKLKGFFHQVWKSIEEAQMARANAALKNKAWSRIE